jgi:3-oxoacyl-(acyl-carrier-protein) synthase
VSVDNLKNKESSRVVVTDAATVTALGNNLESLWQELIAGETAIRPITRFSVDQDHYKAKIAARRCFFHARKISAKGAFILWQASIESYRRFTLQWK